jgi:hypothetical protein
MPPGIAPGADPGVVLPTGIIFGVTGKRNELPCNAHALGQSQLEPSALCSWRARQA